MATREELSFCRICNAACGVALQIENNRIRAIRADRHHPTTRGYACFKGLQAAEAHHGPARLLHSLKRMPDGGFARVASEQALDEIAERLRQIESQDGPDAIAMFTGTGTVGNAAMFAMQRNFMTAIGSSQLFSTATIDQSAKFISFDRLGGWAAGPQHLDNCDVLLIFGCNPLVSHGGMGWLDTDPTKRLKDARARGMKLIVVDPRRSETARAADLMLQPYPGQDSAIAAGMLRLILSEGWHDRSFCADYVGEDRIAELAAAVDRFTPERVERRADLAAGQLRAAALLFARDSKMGIAVTGTGPSMAPFSNLTQHLVDCLNVVCGRFPRAGMPVRSVDPLGPPIPPCAEVIAPSRSWEKVPQSRIRGAGSLMGERLAATLADEILTPGKGQIKALIVCGSNPVAVVPDQEKAVRAMDALSLSVAIEPYLTTTARRCDYILAPTLQYERPDLTMSLPGFVMFPQPWARYTPPVIAPPAGSDVHDDWYFLWAIAKRLNHPIMFDGKVWIDMETAPSTDDLLAIRASNARVTLDELKQYARGRILDLQSLTVQPKRPEADGRFDVMPADVRAELDRFAAVPPSPGRFVSNGEVFSHLLVSHRMRDVLNSQGLWLRDTRRRVPYNPAYLHPDDLAARGLRPGDHVEIVSDHNRVVAIVAADPNLKRGVVAMSHGWGVPRDGESDPERDGAPVNRLISTDRDMEPINAMPRMSAIPVNIIPLSTPKRAA